MMARPTFIRMAPGLSAPDKETRRDRYYSPGSKPSAIILTARKKESNLPQKLEFEQRRCTDPIALRIYPHQQIGIYADVILSHFLIDFNGAR